MLNEKDPYKQWEHYGERTKLYKCGNKVRWKSLRPLANKNNSNNFSNSESKGERPTPSSPDDPSPLYPIPPSEKKSHHFFNFVCNPSKTLKQGYAANQNAIPKQTALRYTSLLYKTRFVSSPPIFYQLSLTQEPKRTLFQRKLQILNREMPYGKATPSH